MKHTVTLKALVLLSLTVGLPTFAEMFVSPKVSPQNVVNISKLKVISPHLTVAGQPKESDFKALKAEGYTLIINLRTAGELNFDEANAVADAGLKYVSLPITGKDEVNFANASELASLLEKHQGDKVLLHCGSGNRVGALIALDHFAKTGDKAAALKKGKQHGMTRLTEHVTHLMDNH